MCETYNQINKQGRGIPSSIHWKMTCRLLDDETMQVDDICIIFWIAMCERHISEQY